MSNQQSRRTGHGRTRGRSKVTAFASSQKPGFGRVPVRQAVFELGPRALRAFLEIEQKNEDVEQGSEDEAVETDEEQADLDDRDEDDLWLDDEPGEWYSNRYLARLGESFEFAGLPVLDISDKYAITIGPGQSGGWRCTFQEPTWFHRAMTSEGRPYIERLMWFLRGLAEWLEEERQPFLAEPMPSHFLAFDSQFSENPVILQNGFLTRVNNRLDERFQINQQDFSRLADKIWLIWPQWNMPLKNVFSREYATEWVIQGCLRRYTETGVWFEDLSDDFTQGDLKQAKRKSLENLTLEELLRVLADIGNTNPKHAQAMMLARINARQLT